MNDREKRAFRASLFFLFGIVGIIEGIAIQFIINPQNPFEIFPILSVAIGTACLCFYLFILKEGMP